MRLLTWLLLVTLAVPLLCYGDAIEEALLACRGRPRFAYPYVELCGELYGGESVPLFAYGSLVDYHSARRTLSDAALRSRRPALAYGLRRLFNRDIPLLANSSWGQPLDARSRAMLNVVVTGKAQDKVNGILLDIPAMELKALAQREGGYDLVAVPVTPWQPIAGHRAAEVTLAWTFSARDNDRLTDNAIWPRPGYYELARDAARQYGEAFAALWLVTTYLADGRTPVWLWEKAVQAGEERTLRRAP